MVEDNTNKIFITTANGLSVFDGVRWMAYSVPSSPLFRCIDYDPATNKLFAGADNQFGYWIQNEYGEYIYHSLYTNQDLNKPDIFWRVYVIKDKVYFQTEQSVLSYCNTTQRIDTLLQNKPIGYLHELNDTLYLQQGKELYRFENSHFIPTGLTTESRIVNLFGYANNLLAATERDGLLIQHTTKFEPLNRPTNSILQQSVVFSAKQYTDSIYLVGTVLDGAYLINSEGYIIEKIGHSQGLEYTTVLSIYIDKQKNIWLGLDGGLSKVTQSNILTEQTVDFSKHSIGRVYAMAHQKNSLFLGTNKGLFQLSTNSQPHIIPGTQGQVWNIIETPNLLVVCHDKGICLIKDAKPEWIDVPLFWTMKPLNLDLGYYASIDYEGGFSLYQILGNHITYEKKLHGYTGSHTSFDVDRYGDIWVIDRLNQPVHIILNKTLWEIDKVNKYTLPSQVSELNASLLDGDVLFFNHKTAYKYDKLDNSILADPYYSQLVEQTESNATVFTQLNDYFFYLSLQDLGIIKRDGNHFFNYGTLFKNQDIKTIPPLGRKIIYTTPNSIVIGLQDKIGIYNISNQIKQDERCINHLPSISKIELDVKGKTFLQPIDYLQTVYNLPYDYFRFNIYLSNLSSNNQISYRINSGKWKTENAAPFFQLPYLETGNHLVEIKNLRTDESIVLHVTVKTPWYLSGYFIAVSFLLIVSLSILIRSIFKHRMKKQQEKYIEEQEALLEKEKNEHEIKLLKLKLGEEEKKLINSTMYAIKRNAMLGKIRDEVESVIPLCTDPLATKKVKSAVKTIETYLDNKENWTVFEKYFNSIYDGFFERLFAIHPNITPNEMKLCALIKLSFPSKEIATYLNISDSSVEIARYRLRKKMNIEHEQSLFAYISSI